MSVTIVVPAYNEEGTIGRVLDGVKKAAGECEIIVVDDCSEDGTAEIAKKSGVKLLQHERNMGYGAAMKTGVKSAGGEFVLFMDADGQHDPAYIPELLEQKEDYDMVVGERKNLEEPPVKKFGRKVLGGTINYLCGEKIPDFNSGFRLVKRETVIKFMEMLPDTFSFTTTLTLCCIAAGCRVKYVPVTLLDKENGGMRAKNVPVYAFVFFRSIWRFNPLKVFAPLSAALLLLAMLGAYLGTITLSAVLLALSAASLVSGIAAERSSFSRRVKEMKNESTAH